MLQRCEVLGHYNIWSGDASTCPHCLYFHMETSSTHWVELSADRKKILLKYEIKPKTTWSAGERIFIYTVLNYFLKNIQTSQSLLGFSLSYTQVILYKINAKPRMESRIWFMYS